MRLIVFHYHLLPGGVTDVIVHSVRAVCRHDQSIAEVRLVTGRPDNGEAVVNLLSDLGTQITIDVMPELDYTDPAEATATAVERAEVLERTLVAAYGADDAIWWIHNYHLGKNPSFTRAVCAIAKSSGAPRMVLHIHDFPECARYENLAYLNRVAGPSPYPAGDLARYAVINERDRRALLAAGVPDHRIGLLLNPVPDVDSGSPPRSREQVAARLADFAADHGQRFHPDGPILLYPVRTIRRKNVLEIASIARLAPGTNLVVTLPGVSEPERAYSELVRYAYADRRIHGVWGIGRRESEYDLSFGAITAAADMIVSSSVQEGFGLLFVNALLWRKPLLARRLDVLSGIETLFADYPARFYDSFLVPVRTPSITSMHAYLRMRYSERLDELGAALPDPVREKVEGEIDELLAGESIDFSFLPAQMQLTVLGDMRDRGFGAYVRAMNAAVVSMLENIPSGTPPDTAHRLTNLLGYRDYAARFARLVGASGASPHRSEAGRHESAQDVLLAAFAGIGQLRLLLGPIDHNPHQETHSFGSSST